MDILTGIGLIKKSVKLFWAYISEGIVFLTLQVIYLQFVFLGNEVWFHGFGKEDMLSGKDVDHNSAFLIASVTKSFTATLLGILLSENG